MSVVNYLVLTLKRIFKGQAKLGDYLVWGFCFCQLTIMLTVATLTVAGQTDLSFSIKIFFLIPTLICAIIAFILLIKSGLIAFQKK